MAVFEPLESSKLFSQSALLLSNKIRIGSNNVISFAKMTFSMQIDLFGFQSYNRIWNSKFDHYNLEMKSESLAVKKPTQCLGSFNVMSEISHFSVCGL